MTQEIQGYALKYNSAYQIFRGIKNADKQNSGDNVDTSVIELAQSKANYSDNKSAITVALEDFSEATTGFNGQNVSNVNLDDSELTFFEKLASFFGVKNDNIFKSDEGKTVLSNHEHVSQNDIFESDIAMNGGIKYAKNGDDLYQSALNFAKADIGAIEKAYSMANPDYANSNQKLEMGEIKSYLDYSGVLSDAITELDLGDSKKKLTPEEYASYILAVDSLGNADGLISKDEADKAGKMKNEELTELAKQIYEQYN